MGFERQHRLDTELNRLLDDLARPPSENAAEVPGKRTLVEPLVDPRSARHRAQHAAAGPGRRTLVERLLSAAQTLSFDDFRVLALKDVLRSLGRRRELAAATVAAADREVARRAIPPDHVSRALPGAGGQAMWQAAERRAATLYRRAFDAGEVSPDDPAIEAALARAGSGAPLPAAVRRKMEDALGMSLARVRVHTDQVAARAARAVRAEAFTVGEDIFFADGAYAPESRAGQQLLAHELAHVVQTWQGKSEGAGGAGLRVSQPGESLEREADAVAERITGASREASGRGEPVRADAGTPPAPGASPGSRARPLAEPAARATAARTLQRKESRPAPGPTSGEPSTIQPMLRRQVKRVPTAAAQPGDARAEFQSQLDAHAGATQARLGAFHGAIHEAKQTKVGARSSEHARQDNKKAEDHKHTSAAVENHHRALAEAHKGARPGGHEEAPAREHVEPHSPIQFKKIDSWDKYMPQTMASSDARERARIQKLVKRKVEGERAGSQKAFARLHAAQIQQAAAIRSTKPALQGQIAAAQGAALTQVAASEASQAAAVGSAYAAAQTRVNRAAGAAKVQVNAAYTAAIQAINDAYQKTDQKLTQGQTRATTGITTAETLQIASVQAIYTGARAQVDAAAATEASYAAGLADAVPLPYDGDKLDAARKAAHDTADGWAQEIPGKMQEDAEKNIYSNQPQTERGVHDIASQQKDQIKTAHDKLKEALDTAHPQALEGAALARTQALAQIDAMAASTCASLAAQSAAQVAAVHQQTASARAGITRAAQAAQASLAQTCDKSAAGLEKGATGLVKGAKEVEAPNPEGAETAARQGEAQLKSGAASIVDGLKKSAIQSAHGLSAQAASAAQGMAGIAAQARTGSAQIAQGASQSISQAGQSTSQSLQKMGADFQKQAQGIGDGADQAYQGIVTDIHTAYRKAATSLSTGTSDAASNLARGYHGAIDDQERAEILANAKQAADAVKPWWQQALAFVLVIVVSIVVTVAVTALTGGLGTGPVMAALVAIGTGALAGGLSSAAGQIVNNLVMGRGAFDDFSWSQVGIGALAGGLTAGMVSGVTAVGGATIRAAMTEGSATFATLGGFAIRTGVNFGAGMASDAVAQLAINGKYEFSMQNLITTLGFSAAMSTTRFTEFQNKIGDGIRTRVGLDPIHVEAPSVEGAHPTGEGGTREADPAPAGSSTEPTGHRSTEPTGRGSEPGTGANSKPGEGRPKPGEGDSKPEGHKPEGHKPDEHGQKPEGQKPEKHGQKPGETGETGGPREQQAHDEARDSELKADGYSEGTRAKADETTPDAPAPRPEAGLKDTALTERFASEMKGLKDKWPTMKPGERANALADIINGHLQEAGVPELRVKTEAGTSANGHLDFQKWEILVNEGKLNAPTIDEAKLGELANTIYHEARHGEQWYMMARHMAEGGMSPAEISAKTRIPETVCEAAAARPKMSPQQQAEAQKYYNSVYGTGSAHRNQVLSDLKTKPGKVQAAKTEYEAAMADPKTTPAERQARLKAWQDAYARYQADYQAYRHLPEEADAWAAGDAAEAAFKSTPKPGPTRTEPTTGKTGPETSNPPAHSKPGKTDLEPGKAKPPEAPPMIRELDPDLVPPGFADELQHTLAGDAPTTNAILRHLQRLGPGQRDAVRADDGMMNAILSGRSDDEVVKLVAMLGFPTIHEEVHALKSRLGSETFKRVLPRLSDRAVADAIDASFAHPWSRWDELLPEGAAMPPRVRVELYKWAIKATDPKQIRQVMERRFGVQITRDWGVDDWPADALRAVWHRLDQLPTAHVTENAMLRAIRRVAARERRSGGVAVHGNTPSYGGQASGIEVGFRDQDVGARDDGLYTTADQLLSGVPILPSAAAHEIAHTLDLAHDYTGPGQAFRTHPALGTWKVHSDAKELLETLLQHIKDPGEYDRAKVIRALETGERLAGEGPLIDFVNNGRHANHPAYRTDQSRVLDGRYYYQASNTSYWTSYDAAIRAGHGPSNYAYEDVKEFFAELYALYYSTPVPGTAMRAWNQAIYDWFTNHIDRGYSTPWV